MPLRVNYFLKSKAKQEDINAVFKEDIEIISKITSYHSSRDERFMHSLLLGFPYDEDLGKLDYILCGLEKSELEKSKLDSQHPVNNLIIEPITFNLKVYDKKSSTTHLKIIGSYNNPQTPKQHLTDLRYYNGSIYFEAYISELSVSENDNEIVSMYDLEGKNIELKIAYSYTMNFDSIKDDFYFTRFNLICGNKPFNILELDLKKIGRPKIEPWVDFNGNKINTSEMFDEIMGKMIVLKYDVPITSAILENSIKEVI